MKNASGDMIILHLCTTNYDQMMYSSWDMAGDRWKDRQKKWNIEVGTPLEKMIRWGIKIYVPFFVQSILYANIQCCHNILD